MPEFWMILVIAGGAAVASPLPEGEKRHYQQSAALALGVGFVFSLVLSRI